MKSFKFNIHVILLILFEVVVGILLLTNPEAFTRTVIILFGIILLTIGTIYLIRYLHEKENGCNNPVTLFITVVTLIAGAIFALFSSAIINLIAAIAVIYGVILVLSGIFKLHNYFLAKKAEIPVSTVGLASGIIAIILGLVIAVYPKEAAFSVWQVAGIMLIVEAVIDFFSIIQVVRRKD